MEIELKGNKDPAVKDLIFKMLDILGEVGIPLNATHRRLERMSMACLAVGHIKHSLHEARSTDDNSFMTTREIIAYENKNFGEKISLGSYDDIRRKDLLLLVQAGIVVNSSSLDLQATNNPTRGYALNPLFAELLICYGIPEWQNRVEAYKQKVKLLNEGLQKRRDMERVPVRLPSGMDLLLSFGEHNLLQKKIVEEFLPRFGMGAEILYIGDTSDKYLYMNKNMLQKIHFFTLQHDELPDIVAYSQRKNLLFLIEAVHSTGPMSDVRVLKLKRQLTECTAYPIFVTAFIDKKIFRKWVMEIAWESEVWIADNPDHMVHFNGNKFLDLYK